ncbi:MAG: hypothetical protein JSV33_09440 [bacterium]|nr:MAG: hypothetical protein JSV33_09440 [bacterium]
MTIQCGKVKIAILGCAVLLALCAASSCPATTKSSLGIYLYENIEGYHTTSSTAGTELSNKLLKVFDKVMVFDKVPLESNETVGILEKMTEDRKVTVTAISTWLTGNVISAPSITFADDDIKFKDLTWHIDQDVVLAEARKNTMTYVLIGSFDGIVKKVGNKKLNPDGRLLSVTVLGNIRLIDVAENTIIWAKTYQDIKNGFDARIAFDKAVSKLSGHIGKDATQALSK